MIHFYWQDHGEWGKFREVTRPTGNTETMFWVHRLLAKYGPIRNGRIGDPPPTDTEPGDVLVGHIGSWGGVPDRAVFPVVPWPGVSSGTWYDQYVFGPEANRATLDAAKMIFAICGEHQLEISKQDPLLLRWLPKVVRLDGVVDTELLYPRMKRSFSPPGERGFLYMGMNCHEKGTRLFWEAQAATGFKAVSISDGRVEQRNLTCVTEFQSNTNVGFWQRIMEQCDFVVCPARVDCQPQSVLENVARGLVPIVTAASGFDGPAIRIEATVESIISGVKLAHGLSDDELRLRQDSGITHIREHHSPKRFTATLEEHMHDDLMGANIRW